MPTVSVIIPAHNRKGFIENAVRSVLEQTYQDFEIIIVDDASTDDTFELATRLAQDNPRIHVEHHQTNRGAQAARNTGIRSSRGEWIAFLDSDDLWLPESLAVRLQLALKTGVQVVHSACYILKAPESELEHFPVPPLHGSVYKNLLEAPGPVFPSLLVSKQALVSIGYLDDTIMSYQEWDTSIMLAKQHEFTYVSEPTFIYDCRHNATISKDSARAAAGYEQVVTKHRWSILRYLGPKALSSHYQMAGGFYSQANSSGNARSCFRKARLLWPFNLRAAFNYVRHLQKSEVKR